MPIAVNLLTSGTDATDSVEYTTASISPTSNALILLSVMSRKGTGTPATPSITSTGLTWVQIAATAPGNRKLSLFRAMGSPGADVVVISFGAETQTHCSWIIAEFTGVDTSGTNGSGAIVQVPTPTSGTSTNATITLSAFGSSNNMAYMSNTHDANTTVTPGTNCSGYTEIIEVAQAENGSRLQAQYQLNCTTASASWSASQNWIAQAVEIKSAAVAATTIMNMPLMGVG